MFDRAGEASECVEFVVASLMSVKAADMSDETSIDAFASRHNFSIEISRRSAKREVYAFCVFPAEFDRRIANSLIQAVSQVGDTVCSFDPQSAWHSRTESNTRELFSGRRVFSVDNLLWARGQEVPAILIESRNALPDTVDE